jgi:amidase
MLARTCRTAGTTLEHHSVMPGLVPGIHVLPQKEDVDGRDKPGHDAEGGSPFSQRALAGLMALSLTGLVLTGPAAAAEVRYDPGDKVYFTYCHAHPPALRIRPGDSVITSTRDASNDVFAVTDKTVSAKLDLTKVNPQTGPFYIEGAEPGDTLEVHIDSIEPNRDWGWGASIPYFGLLAPEYKTAMVTQPVPDKLFIWRLDKTRKIATIDMPNSKIGKIEVPIRPFFGTIGTAPSGKECISSLVPGAHGANMDFNEVVAGVTMQFPVFEPGALFMLGDGHSAQGDGEIDGAAIETPFNVRFTVNLIKGKKINWPRLINETEIMSIGSTRPLIDAMRIACVDMVDWLMADYGFDRYDAVQLLGQTAHLYIANVVDPQFSVACALNKKYLPR